MNRIYQTLGIASRARMLATGETLMKRIRSKDVYLVLVSDDASLKTKKMYQDKCTYYHIPMVIFGQRQTLNEAIGKSNVVAVGIVNEGFAKKVYDQLKEVVS
jgi:ribosomal protein L7Ae-like RNA K-turn-binding protein